MKTLTVKEVAKELRINEQTVRNLIAEGKLKAFYASPRAIRIAEEDLQAYIQSQRTQK